MIQEWQPNVVKSFILLPKKKIILCVIFWFLKLSYWSKLKQTKKQTPLWKPKHSQEGMSLWSQRFANSCPGTTDSGSLGGPGVTTALPAVAWALGSEGPGLIRTLGPGAPWRPGTLAFLWSLLGNPRSDSSETSPKTYWKRIRLTTELLKMKTCFDFHFLKQLGL